MILRSLFLTLLLASSLQATTLDSISPTSSPAGSGPLQLTLNGSFNNDGTTVYWFSNATNSTFQLDLGPSNSTKVTANIPPSLLTQPDTVFVYVVEGSSVSEQRTFTVTPVTSITALTPNSILAGSGNFTLSVSGTNIPTQTNQVPTTVLWNGQSLQSTVVSPTQITAIVPASLVTTPGTAQVTISTTPNPSPLTFTITAPLSLTSLAPNSAPVGSPSIKIQLNGTGFTQNTVVTWNGGLIQSAASDSTTITASVPAGLLSVPGVAQVAVAASGQPSPPPLPFFVGSAPTLSSISPTSAVAGGAQFTLTLNGANFVQNTTAVFNSTQLSTTFVSGNQLTAIVPASLITQAGSATVTTRTSGFASNGLPFAITSPPVSLTQLQPNTTVAGSAAFTLAAIGTGFTTSSQIAWEGSPLSTTFVNSTRLTATITASLVAAPGATSVTVVTPGAPATSPLPFTITHAPFTLTSITPNTTVAGSPNFNLLANGTGFDSGAVVTWNGTSLTTTFISASQLSAAVPANLVATAGTANVGVAETGQSPTGTLPFTITQPSLTLTSISPNTTVAGSPTFTLTANGTNFTATTLVTWNGTSLTTTFVNSNVLTASVPGTLVATAGTAAVGVVSPTQASPPTLPFTITQPGLTLTSISPNTTTAGSPGFTLVANGSGFSAGTVVTWNGTSLTTTFVSSTVLNAAVPATFLTTVGTAAVGVTSSGQTSPPTLPFTITQGSFTLINLSPNTIVAGSPQFSMSAFGTGFTLSANMTWNGTPLGTTFVSATQLNAVVPATLVAAVGTANVCVVQGTQTSCLPFTITATGVTLTSISPNSAIAGSAGFSLIATGTGFTSGSSVTWNGTTIPTTFNSATQLTADVSSTLIANVGTASVGVTVPGQTSPNPLTFTITSGLTLTSLSPASALAGSAGFTLSASGTGFNSGTILIWNGSALSTSVSSATNLTASVPQGLIANVGTASVTAVNGTLSSNSLTFSITGQPVQLFSVSPNTAPAGSPPITITVSGSGFQPPSGTAITWNGISLSTQVLSSTTLTATVPQNLLANPGTVAIGVTGGSQPSSLPFIVTGSLTLTSVSPNTVGVGGPGFTLLATGTGFTPNTIVTWNGVGLPTTYLSPTQLNAAVPAGLLTAAGDAQVTVVLSGQPSPGPLPVHITSNITLTSLSPNSAIAGSAGFTLVGTGTGFLPGATLNWNGAALPTTFVSSNQLTAAVSNLLIALPGNISVTASNNSPSSTGAPSISNALTFVVLPPTPTITSLSPSTAVPGGPAFSLSITGTGYLATSTVTWNGVGLAATFVSPTQLTAQVSTDLISKAGTATVVVSNGQLNSNGATFTIKAPPPSITTISPATVVAGSPGFSLAVTGTGFVSGAAVSLNGTALATTFGSATQVTATVPADLIAKAGSAQVSLSNPDGQSSNSVTLTITVPAPTLTSISPATVTQGGPAFTLTVNGTNFVSGTAVSLGGTGLTTTFVSATQVTAAVPATAIQQPGNLPVTATNPGSAASNPLPLAVTPPVPTITSLSPNTAVAGGPAFTLTVNGTNFLDGAAVSFNGTALNTTVVSPTQVTAQVTAALIAQPGAAQVTVNNRGGAASAPAAFAITPAGPVITSIDPVSARVGDATFTLSVTGTGFVQASVVQWDGAPLSTTFVSPTQLTATIAAGRLILPATASVTVANPGPNNTPIVSNAVNFTINAVVPALTSIAPNSATAGDPAFTLTVNGSNLLSLTVIQWNNTQLTTRFVNANQVMADVPASLLTQAGSASVTAVNPGNNVSNALTFTINPVVPAVLSTLSRTSAITGEAPFTLTLTGTGFRTGAVVNFGTTPLATTVVSATQLTAAVTAAVLATPATFQVTVQQAGTTSNALSFVVSLPPPPALRLVAPTTIVPGQQTTIDFGLNTPYPLPLTGLVTVTFVSNATIPVDDPMIQLATGGRTLNFTVPANTTALPTLQIQTGTVAGTITVTVTLTAAGVNVTPANSSVTLVVAKTAPVMISGKVKLIHAPGYIEVDITGFSTTRDMVSATFHLNVVSGGSLITSDFTVPVSSLFTSWFSSAPSTAFGGQFSYAQPFNLIGDTNQIQSVTVTLTNSAGTSVSMTTN